MPNEALRPAVTYDQIAYTWADETIFEEHAATIISHIPDDLKHLDTYITARVCDFLRDEIDCETVGLLTDSVVIEVQGKLAGYRSLGRNATNRSSLVAIAFGE